MKKLYIPTSTLNFNNILSSESISPKAFYDKRGFGYSRWAIVPENPFHNAIVLYDNLCHFVRPKSNIEDHPLLVEILLDETKLKQAEGFWYCDHTIYLAPTATRFLFFSETDKTITLSMSESSLETKLLRLYARQIQTIQKPTEFYKPISSGEPCGLNEQEIEKDVKTNKMKGMLYGYYIGSLLSSDADSVKYLNVLKEIHNIFAAILSSFEKRPTAYQNERLDALFDYLNEQDTDFKSLYEIISSSIDNKSKTKKVWEWIFGKHGHLKKEDKSVWLSYLQYAPENDNKENQAINWIKTKIEEAKRRMYANRHLLSPNDSEIVVMDNKVSSLKNSNIINEVEDRLCISWLNETLSDKNTHGRISTYKEELATNLTLKAKEIYQDSWEECQTRTYLNDLRRHIAGAEFSHKWNNGLLSSIAAVIIAGDDWEKLLAFMQSKSMTDYKLAFAFYATLNGFANLTRDFTDVLYSQKDKNYVWDVYKEFYGQLFGVTLDTKVIDEGKITEGSNSFDNISEFTNFMESICKKCKSAKKDETIYKKYYSQYGLSMALLDAIKKETSLQNGKGAQKTVIKCIEKLINCLTEKKKIKISSLSLFQEENRSSMHIIGFEDAITFIQNKTPEQIRKNLIENLKYIDKEYTGSGKYVNTGDNPVKHFQRLCFSMSNKWNRIEETSENRKYVEQICKILSGNR